MTTQNEDIYFLFDSVFWVKGSVLKMYFGIYFWHGKLYLIQHVGSIFIITVFVSLAHLINSESALEIMFFFCRISIHFRNHLFNSDQGHSVPEAASRSEAGYSPDWGVTLSQGTDTEGNLAIPMTPKPETYSGMGKPHTQSQRNPHSWGCNTTATHQIIAFD